MGEIVTNYDKTDDLVFRYETRLVDSKQRAEELEQVLDACEQNNAQHIKRIMALEQLCRDMYPFIDELGLDTVCGNPDGEDCQQPCDKCEYYIAPIRQCMEQLGLLEGGDK